MKHSLGWMIVLAMLGLLWPQASRVQAQGETAYTDPNGLYSLQTPTGWKSEPKQGYLLITDPEAQIKTYVLVLEGTDLEKAIAEAWQRVSPGFDLKVRATTKVPVSRIEAAAQVVFDTPRDRVVMGYGQLYQGKAYLLLLDTPVEPFVKRQAQIGIVFSSFKISALQAEADLTEVEALPFDQAMAKELDDHIPPAMQKAGIPGAAMAVVQNGKVVYLRAFGVKELGKPQPVTPDTQMMIGSTGKSLTTLMMASLVDDGKMSWDTPAQQILPSFAVADAELSKQITMKNLVCACTGVPRRDMELVFNLKTLGAEEIVQSLSSFQFFTKFGEAFQYSNQMVAAGGYIAAAAEGLNPHGLLAGYAAGLQKRVLTPIGMKHTTFFFSQVQARGNYATPHGLDLFNQRKPIPMEYERMTFPIVPAGGHWSTVPDMARYLITLLNKGITPEGRRVVSEQNLQVLWTPQVKISADVSYGLGWMVGQYRGLRYLDHGGNTLGFTSGLALVPGKNMGVVVLTNGRVTNTFNDHLIYRVFDMLLGQPTDDNDRDFEFGLQQMAKALKEATDTLQGQVDPAVVEPYLGTFAHPALGNITLSLKEGKLWVDAGEFALELRRRVDKDGRVGYIGVDAPLAGLMFELEQQNSRPTVVLYSPPDNYRFIKR